MQEPEWQSQVGQDEWAYNTLGKISAGKFLDIGCGHTQDRSNTWALEKLGWTGLRIDQGDVHGPERKSPWLQANATRVHWETVLKAFNLWPTVDYLSLDIDQDSADALIGLPFIFGWDFKCATIEHDSYRFGTAPRDRMRQYLQRHGYRLARADVSDQGLEFEDWWVKGYS